MNGIVVYRGWLLLLGLLGLAAVMVAVALLLDVELLARVFLPAVLFGLALPLGAISLRLLHGTTGGGWGRTLLPVLRAAIATLPVMLLLLVPLLFALDSLFAWTAPVETLAEAVQKKLGYLNPTFFTVRTAIYAAGWLLLSVVTLRSGDISSGLAAVGLIVHCLLVTFFGFDWIMSLQPEWYSSIFGMIVILGQGLTALAMGSLLMAGVEQRVQHRHDLGNLLLAVVMLWTYLVFMQYLIMWSANLPHNIIWYVHRNHGLWGWLAVAIMAVHFAAPFGMLLFQDVKRHARPLQMVAGLLLLAHALYLHWQVLPAWQQEPPLSYLLAPLLTALVLVIWLGLVGMGLAHQQRHQQAPGAEVTHG